MESTFPDARVPLPPHKPAHTVGLDAENRGFFHSAQGTESRVGAQPSRAKPCITKARQTKLPEEVDKIRQAAAITESGMEDALRHARLGVSEMELSTLIANKIRAGGGIPRLLSVSCGQRSALADTYATSAKLAKGDLLRLDIACTVDGYWADTARCAVVGEPSTEQEQRYKALLDGELAQMSLARSGVTAADLFKVARQGPPVRSPGISAAIAGTVWESRCKNFPHSTAQKTTCQSRMIWCCAWRRLITRSAGAG